MLRHAGRRKVRSINLAETRHREVARPRGVEIAKREGEAVDSIQ